MLVAMEGGRVRWTLGVVPAKAGTHTAESLDCGWSAYQPQIFANHRPWLWVPAFAGTTSER
ncbi:hypothetical protein ACVIN2_004729 [Bradyrhizobium sp. USDA 3650]